jgi:hypothetical protein
LSSVHKFDFEDLLYYYNQTQSNSLSQATETFSSVFFATFRRLSSLSAMKKPTDKQMQLWLESVWRDGFDKGVDGRDELPDFADFDPRLSDGSSTKPDYSELAQFNPCKCGARTYKDGYPVQCSRSHLDGEFYCKTHLKKFNDAQGTGFNLRFGQYDGDRPTHWLDKSDGAIIAWHDVKKTKSSSSNTSSSKKTKMKVGELREFLSNRIPNEQLRGLKKPELEALYEKQMNSSPEHSSDSETEPLDSPKNLEEFTGPEPEPDPEPAPEPESEPEAEPESEPEAEPESEPEAEPEAESEPDLVLEPEESESMTEIDRQALDQGGEFVGKSIIVPHEPEVTSPRSQLIDELRSLKNSEKKKRAKASGATEDDMELIDDADDVSQALVDLIISLELPPKVEAPVEDSDDEDLDEDKSNYDEITHDGVDYLEDEETGDVYNMEFKLVGKWNENADEIMWKSDNDRLTHESKAD